MSTEDFSYVAPEVVDPAVAESDHVQLSIMGHLITGDAGRPVLRGSGSGREVPGAVLYPKRSAELQAALRAIKMAEVEGAGPGVIGGRPYGL